MRIGFDAKCLYNNFTGLGNYSRTLLNNPCLFFPENKYYLYIPKTCRDMPALPLLENPDYRTTCYGGMFKSLWHAYGIKKNLRQAHTGIYHGLNHEMAGQGFPFARQQSGIQQPTGQVRRLCQGLI